MWTFRGSLNFPAHFDSSGFSMVIFPHVIFSFYMSFEEFILCWTLCLMLVNVSVLGLPSWKEIKELYYLFVWEDIAVFPMSECWYVNYRNIQVSNQRLFVWAFIRQGNHVSANVLFSSLRNHPHSLAPVLMWVPVWFNVGPAEFSEGSFSLVWQMCEIRLSYALSVL